MKTPDLFRIQENLLLAAGGELPFTRVIDTVISAFNGAGGVIFELNRKNGAFSNWCGRGVEAGEDEYIQHINTINPRMHYSMRHVPGHICYDGKFIDDRSMDRHEFYNWLSDVDQFRYFIGSRVYDEGDVSLFTSVEFVAAQGHAETETIEAFRRIAPSIGNAWRIAKRSAGGSDGTQAHSWTPDHLPWSIFAVDLNASLVQMNQSARQMLEAGKVFCVEDGALRPKDRQARVRFEQAMTLAMKGMSSETLLSSGNGVPPLVAQFMPVNPSRLPHPSPVSALIYVWDPLHNAAGLGTALERLYGLTVAEAQLAELLATGVELSSAAATLEISRNTARNHLQQVFAKTGTHRQGEFLTRIMGVLRD